MDNWKTKQKIIVQVVSLLLSISLWLYVTNTENPIRTVEINKVPVQLLNTNSIENQGMALAPDQNIYVDLKIEGSSQDVYKVNKDDFKIQIDLEEYALKVGDNSIPITIVETPSSISIKNTSNLVVTVKVEELTEKDLKVESRIDVAAKVNYYAFPMEIEPEIVTVSGPKSLVDKVATLVVQGQEDNVAEDLVKNYEVIALDENGYVVDGIKFSTERVQVTIKVNSGKSVPIKITTTGTENSDVEITSMELSQNYVEIVGPDYITDGINEIYTEAVDLSSINKSSKLEVALVIPEGVEKTSISYVTLNVTVQANSNKNNNQTTKEIEVEYTTSGLAAGLNMTSSTNKVKVTLSGDKNELDAISAENITANIDLSSITDVGEYKETPSINISGNVQGISINSVDSVTVTITKEEVVEGAFDEATSDTTTLVP